MKKNTITLALLALLTFLAPAACAADQTARTPTPAEIGAGLRKLQPAADAAIKHDLIIIDEGLNNLLRVNERAPSASWCVALDVEKPRDLQLIGGGRLLVGFENGYLEYNLADGKLLKKFASLKGVTSARRQPDGSTLIACADLGGKKGIYTLTLDANDKITGAPAAFPLQHDKDNFVRLIRQTEQGTYLMPCQDELREGAPDGRYLKKYPVEGFHNMWKAVRLPNKHIIASSGYGAFMVELDETGAIVRKWGGKDQVPAGVNPYFAATFQLLANGHVVLANWQGHGTNNGSKGVQIIEYDRDGKIVWQWSPANRAALISSLQGVLVLDGLDLARLHDERAGVMAPVETCTKNATP